MATANYEQQLSFAECFDSCSSVDEKSNYAITISESYQSEEPSSQQPIIESLTDQMQLINTNNNFEQPTYNQSGNAISLSQITRECAVCATVKPYSQFLGNYSETCHHLERSVCDSCVYDNTKFLVENTSIYDDQVQCPEPNCNATFDFHAIRDILLASGKSHLVFEKYDKKLISRYLEEMTEFVWCAHECASGQLHDLEQSSNPEVICIKCQLRTCFRHRTVWHTGMTCAEYDLQQKQLPDDGTCAWLDQNTKRCPQCRWYIEKNSGCDEMKCRRCQHKFCWQCQADYKLISSEGKSSHRSWCSHYKPKPTDKSGQHQTQRWCNVQ